MTIIKRSLNTVGVRQVDAAMTICDLFSEKDARFDIVAASLDGSHGTFINTRSEKAYLILEGSGVVEVGNETVEVGKMDFVLVPPNVPHGISGKLEFLIVTSPPFDGRYETRLQQQGEKTA